MAIFRNVNMSFWTDTKVVDDYTPEDRYFMLYALTNNYTNIIGCYEISVKQMSNDLGYKEDVVKNLLKRFKEIHNTIDYDYTTKELLIVNWSKYNWNVSPKLDVPLFNSIKNIKSDKFHDILATFYNNRDSIKNKKDDTLLIPYRYGIQKNEYPMDTTITITSTISNNNNKNNNNISIKKLEEEFENIWNNYPNKKGKSNALKYYIRARKKGTSEKIIHEGVKEYAEYIKNKKIKKEFIKHGSTWFNNECWNDEYEEDEKINKNPEWFNKDIKEVQASDKEKEDMEKLLSEFR